MANSHCDGEHTPGQAFESGNVYCKRCGEFLICIKDIEKVWAAATFGDARPEIGWDENGFHDFRNLESVGNEGLTVADDDCEDEI